MTLRTETAGMTLGAMLRDRAAALPDKVCLHYLPNGEKLTYAELDQATNSLADGLSGIGVSRGSIVSILTENRMEQLLCYFALAKLGAASVPINPAAKGYFLERFVGQSDSSVIIMEPTFLDNLAAVRSGLPELRTIILFDSFEQPGEPPEVPAELVGLHILPYDSVKSGDPAPRDDAEPRDLAQILYTSGTTGPSKGNMYAQSALLNWGRQLSIGHDIRQDDIQFIAFPLFHAGAWLSVTMTTLWAGGTVAIERKFSASQFFRQARDCGATVTLIAGGTPFLVAQAPSPSDRDHSLRQLCCGPPPADMAAFEERFNLRLSAGFGLSDFGISHGMSGAASRDKLGSCGAPLADIEVQIVDADGFELPAGQIGELRLRNNTPGGSSSGYYKMPEATIASRQDLWFHTGDYAYVDADGYLFYVDRKKDAIRRRGENISSVELEQVIVRHDAVAACAIFPIKAESEDDVAATVLVKPGFSLSEADLVAHCVEHMPAYAVPRYVSFANEFPLTGSGKVEKHKLRALMEENLSSTWDRERQPGN